MFYNNINPTLITLGPFEIRYYGLIFVIGFIVAYFMIRYLVKKRELNLSNEDVTDFLLYLAIGVVLGARIFYVAIYNPTYYLQYPLKLFALWQGGLSFHGGLVGGIISTFIFAKIKKIHFYDIADITVIPLAFGLFLGRIGNFLNGELYGRVTGVPWAVKFKDAEGFRHPSQLYESLKNLFIFFALWKIKDKKVPKGFLFWSFVILYSVLRFIIEFFRAPDEQLGFIIFGLTMGQLLCILMVMIGATFMLKIVKGRSYGMPIKEKR